MERNARLLTGFVGLIALVVVGHLVIVPYGVDGLWWRWGVRDRQHATDSSSESVVDPTVMTGPPTPSRTFLDSVPSPSTAVQSHMKALGAANREVTHGELLTLGDTIGSAYDAIRALRPYWLHETLDARALIGGQLLGGIDRLRDVAVSGVTSIRLEFFSVQPHWVVRVLMQ